MKEKNSNKSYLEVLRKLRQLIAVSYPDGGWLPPSRDVCSNFNVNRKTYSKALQCLEQDGVARAYPKKGHYINPEFLRAKKIGIIIGNAEESPFFQSDEVLCSVLDVLRENRFNGQLMQAADPNNILDKALIHGVRGLIWLFPTGSMFPYLRNMHKTSELPIMVSSNTNLNEMTGCDVASVSPDAEKSSRTRVNFFAKRKHKKIAVVARANLRNKIQNTMIRLLKEENIDSVFISHDENGKVADMTSLTADPDITGLMIDGGSRDIYDIFHALSQLTAHSLSDLYVHYTEQLDTIRSLLPQIKITAIGHSDAGILGKTAAQILMNCLLKGKPMTSLKVDCFTLTTN